MKRPLKLRHFKRYKDISLLALRYGDSEVTQQIGVEEVLRDCTQQNGDPATPNELVNELERMGPTFVKLGQVLSSRVDLVPPQYIKALSRLQDKVKPFPFSEVEQIITEELGVRISKAFLRFDPEPLAAASLGQVHAAELRDGREVVVKIQRPGICKQIAEDLEVLEELAGFLERHTRAGKRYQFLRVLEEFRHTLLQELDYEREATNLVTVANNLKDFTRIQIPLPIADYSTQRVLTMERVQGKKITEMGPLARLEVDTAGLAEELFRAYLKQILVDGVFHSDPHPGNVFLTDDGRVALLDLGMVGYTSPVMQDSLLKLLLAISEGNSEEVADIAIRLSETTQKFQEADFRRRISQLVAERQQAGLSKYDVGEAILQLGQSAGETGLFVPTELTMLGKTLLQLDEIGRTLDPDFNPNESVRRNASEIMNQRVRKSATSGKFFASLLETKEFVGALPTRLNKIMDAIGNAELEVKVRAADANLFLEGFQKVANRIASGLILAALIVGAALLMRVETDFRIFGYPGLAMLCFLAAGGGGFWLVVSIFFNDQRNRKRIRERYGR
jgi:predicted unusual protein kinase regulating ubiquinone biosynthesis (AarF/ABC1/UbiB family)